MPPSNLLRRAGGIPFNDPQLDRLIRAGLQDSPTLAQAQARVALALSQTQVAQSKLLPSANLDASVLYQRAPENYLIPPPLAGHSFWMGQAGASLGWDLDFWGRQAEAVHRAQALEQSARLDLDNARLMLAGAIAQSYVELYRQYALAEIAERSAAQRENIVNITRRRVAAGLDTQLELRQAEGQLPQARVAREQAQAAAELAVHQLAVLSAQGADAYASIARPVMNVDAALPVPAALPINLLARRPDVLSARAGVAAADAQRLADKAAFYPDVNLKALAGFGAFGLNNLLQWSARGYGVGPLISLPLFDGGRLRAEYKGSEAQLDAAIAGYNDTVLHAVQQTADQLTRIDALARERVDQQADARGQRSRLQTGRGALSRRPRQLSFRAERRNPGAHRAPIHGRHHRRPGDRARDPAPGGGRQLRSARCKYRSSPDEEFSMSPQESADTSSKSSPAPNGRTRRVGLIGLGAAVLLSGFGYLGYWFFDGRYFESTDDAYVNGDVVQVTSEVPGTVLSLNVDDTQLVHAGPAASEPRSGGCENRRSECGSRPGPGRAAGARSVRTASRSCARKSSSANRRHARPTMTCSGAAA